MNKKIETCMDLCDSCVYAGTVAPDNIRHDIMNAWKTGDEAFPSFFLSEHITFTHDSFFEKPTKKILKTFTS